METRQEYLDRINEAILDDLLLEQYELNCISEQKNEGAAVNKVELAE